MMYRAKMTKCQHLVESGINLNLHYVVKDKFDTYLETHDEELAHYIEELNKAQEALDKAQMHFMNYALTFY